MTSSRSSCSIAAAPVNTIARRRWQWTILRCGSDLDKSRRGKNDFTRWLVLRLKVAHNAIGDSLPQNILARGQDFAVILQKTQFDDGGGRERVNLSKAVIIGHINRQIGAAF